MLTKNQLRIIQNELQVVQVVVNDMVQNASCIAQDTLAISNFDMIHNRAVMHNNLLKALSEMHISTISIEDEPEATIEV